MLIEFCTCACICKLKVYVSIYYVNIVFYINSSYQLQCRGLYHPKHGHENIKPHNVLAKERERTHNYNISYSITCIFFAFF